MKPRAKKLKTGAELSLLEEHQLHMRHLELLWQHGEIALAQVGPDGQFIRASEQLLRLLGYTQTELTARTFQSITHPGDVVPDEHEAAAVIRGEQTSYRMDKRYVTKFDRTVHVSIKVIGVFNPETAGFLHFLVIVTPKPQANAMTSAEIEILAERFEAFEKKVTERLRLTESKVIDIQDHVRRPLTVDDVVDRAKQYWWLVPLVSSFGYLSWMVIEALKRTGVKD